MRAPTHSLVMRALLAAALALGAQSLEAQNLVTNPTFDQNLSGWLLSNFDPTWTPLDAGGSPASGSVRGIVPGGEFVSGPLLYQCVQATGGATYDYSVKARFQDAAADHVGS